MISGTPEFWITQLNYIGLAALVVLGLVLLTGVGGLMSFGQAAFVGIGAYTTAYLTTAMGWSPWVALVLGLILTSIVAYVLGAITLRLSGHYLPLGTIAWCLSLYYLFGNLEFLGQYDGIAGIEAIHVFGISLSEGRHIYYLIWVAVLLSMWATRNLLNSRPGRAIRALKGGGGMAESFGINMASYKIIIFVYSALLACLSGWLYAHMQRAVSPSPFGLNYGIEYLFMAVVGGGSSVWGAIVGSGLILILKDQIQNVLPQIINTTANFELVVFGVLMVLVLQYARDGVWPIIASAWKAITGQKASQRNQAAPPVAEALPLRPRPEKGSLVLELDAARKEFGGLVAVNDISFTLRAGEIMGLIGPNGAGKSTTFNLISGVLPTTSGTISFLGKRLDKLLPRDIAKLGVGRTFQHVQLLPTMTVIENVALGAHLRRHVGVAAAALHLERKDEAELLHEAAKQLQRVGLGEYLYEQAGNLALGQQRIIEIARALAADPVLLLLDEPAAGLRYKEKQQLAQVLRQLSDEGMSILLVEHDMDFVMNLTDHLVVMDFGTKLAEGKPDEVQKNPKVLEAYLGGIDDDMEFDDDKQAGAPVVAGGAA
ncbi:branched-chain amino acid ABC transporter ATP-binding protein/permease [Eoetvoesiella caeni]|uniref:Amino acid/amide ABC transporter membrane protein 2 (HAAT family) /amino acid/amide ABC transporter ATP-binding protein 1 (HAAT family) n=1 Tax=Eoetvoesiella caeni TaxID=645616 RepID=A0A366HME6_9BURK|nr:branched-chain amino acid ABC transporter ATP-binding protein/permease [Eoetvoesiella caeni]MCI2807097.1 branched-chain amino acid ABC transporter ATP-binding protein/permease [Eoetvoesiella caeni]NYT53506.1 branched-chain amino acid ABC transporter ATP-binding protein/permease [Eoetvoesiella caeni]RBP43492.1 amino acid/amide ABC transporter membrane protein 2 (HAAT family) /amino acid/amide ABC transporter ATP-binding protein 1 (HAAT family) [Eoetvoesiella caeni]